jgi:hypothetical protein
MCSNERRNATVRRACRVDRPSTYSTNVLTEQSVFAQNQRRTRTWISTRPPAKSKVGQQAVIADDAIELIHTVSRGLPRAANNLALQSLLAAFAERKAIVDHASARIAVNETTNHRIAPRPTRRTPSRQHDHEGPAGTTLRGILPAIPNS